MGETDGGQGRSAGAVPVVPPGLAVSDRDCQRFQALIHREAGIWLAPVKKALLVGVGKIGKRFVLILDLDRVVSADERELARELAAHEAAPTPEPRPAQAGAV